MIDQRLRDLMQDEIVLLGSRALLLQQRVDGIVNDASSYTAVNTRTGYHHCQAKVQGLTRWSHEPLRVCNRLCYLSEAARSQLLYLDSQLQATLSRKSQVESMYLSNSYRDGMKVRTGKVHEIFQNVFHAQAFAGETDLRMYRGSIALRRGLKQMIKSRRADEVC